MKWFVEGVWVAMLEAWQLVKYLIVFLSVFAIFSLLYIPTLPFLIEWVGYTGVGLFWIGVLLLIFILKKK